MEMSGKICDGVSVDSVYWHAAAVVFGSIAFGQLPWRLLSCSCHRCAAASVRVMLIDDSAHAMGGQCVTYRLFERQVAIALQTWLRARDGSTQCHVGRITSHHTTSAELLTARVQASSHHCDSLDHMHCSLH